MAFNDYFQYGQTTSPIMLPTMPGLKKLDRKAGNERDFFGGFGQGREDYDFKLLDLFTPAGTGRILGGISSKLGFGGGGRGGEEGRRINIAFGQIKGDIDKSLQQYKGFTSRGTGSRELQRFGAALNNLRSTREGLNLVSRSKAHAWEVIGKAQGMLKEFGRVGKEISGRGRGRGKGGRPMGGEPEVGIKIPKLPVESNRLPGFDFQRSRSLGGLTPMPAVGFGKSMARVGTPAYRSPTGSKAKVSENPLRAQLDKLNRLLA